MMCRIMFDLSVSIHHKYLWINAPFPPTSTATYIFLKKLKYTLFLSTRMQHSFNLLFPQYFNVKAIYNSCKTILDVKKDVAPAEIMKCDTSTGLVVSCKFGPQCRVPLSELSEPGVDVDWRQLTPHSTVDCYMVKKPRHGAPILSLRSHK